MKGERRSSGAGDLAELNGFAGLVGFGFMKFRAGILMTQKGYRWGEN
jgi:hypothetical protein